MSDVTVKNKKGTPLQITDKGEASVRSTATDRVGALQGTFVVNDTAEVTKNIVGIFVLEDTVFASIKIDGVDVKESYIQIPATAIKAGAYITPITGKVFSGLTLTSGSVTLNLE